MVGDAVGVGRAVAALSGKLTADLHGHVGFVAAGDKFVAADANAGKTDFVVRQPAGADGRPAGDPKADAGHGRGLDEITTGGPPGHAKTPLRMR